MTNLYGRVSAGDRDGLAWLAEGAATPFQKALGLASIEHLLIQVRQPEGAEQYAKQIPPYNWPKPWPSGCLCGQKR